MCGINCICALYFTLNINQDPNKKIDDIFKQYDIVNVDMETIKISIQGEKAQELINSLVSMSSEVTFMGSLADVVYQFFKLWNIIFDNINQISTAKGNIESSITQLIDMKETIKSNILTNEEKNTKFIKEMHSYVYFVHELKECIAFYSTESEIQKLHSMSNDAVTNGETAAGTSAANSFVMEENLKIRWEAALKQMTESETNISALF